MPGAAASPPPPVAVLSAAQRDAVLDDFRGGAAAAAAAQAHADVWRRRVYAPMHIHTPAFADVRAALGRAFPDHVVAFDVVFESDGSRVDWHVDYESLGPFEVPDRLAAVRDGHFATVHFNLTDGGGALHTLPWVWLSYLHFAVVSACGIFGVAHRLLNALSRPLFAAFARAHPSAARAGNAFDNTRLHMVGAGAPRVSYVVRLVRAGGRVGISRASVRAGIARSAACAAFAALLGVVPADATADAARVPWADVGAGPSPPG